MDVSHLAFATIERWMEISGDGRSTVYEKLGDGRLRGIKDGKRLKIDVQHGLQHLRSLPRAQIRSAKKQNANTARRLTTTPAT